MPKEHKFVTLTRDYFILTGLKSLMVTSFNSDVKMIFSFSSSSKYHIISVHSPGPEVL